jgi:uncharacterized membrane protein
LKGGTHVKIGKVVIILFCILLFYASAIGAEQSMVRIQGKIMELDLKRNKMVINEKVFSWDANTIFYNENANPIKVDKFKTDTWVYVEGVRDGNTRQVTLKKIYQLPKYINRAEEDLYPFIH